MVYVNKFKKGSLRFKIPLLIPMVSCISLVLTLIAVYSDHERALERAKTSELKAISEQIASDFLKITGKAESRADMLATMPSIGKAFKDEDCTWLWAQLRPMFIEQNEKYDLSEMQFHKAPASTFLKLHKDGDYGEDLSDFRQTVVSTNNLKSPQKGLELGRAGLGLRGVVPVFYEKEHIGSLEFVFSFKSLINKTKKITGADISIFVNKNTYKRVCTKISNEQEKNEKKITDEQLEVLNTIGNFRYLDSTDKEKIISLMTSTYLSKGTEFYTVFPIVNGKEEGIAIEPLFDFSGAKIGTIVVSKSFDKLNAQYQSIFATNVIIKLMQILLVFVISVITYNVFLMIPLHTIVTIIQNNLNGKNETFEEFTKNDNEIGRLARVLKKLCEISVDHVKDKNKNKDKNKKEKLD
ncbi:MAG: cache domain-containing protein [Pseudomonadota bacterium]